MCVASPPASAPADGGSGCYFVPVRLEPASQRTISILHTEIQEMSAFFMGCANELRLQRDRFRNHAGRSLVLDTNDFLHYVRMDKIPWTAVYGKGARVVIPHVVVDEIDSKSYGEGGNSKGVHAAYIVS